MYTKTENINQIRRKPGENKLIKWSHWFSLFFFIHLIYLCTYMTTAKKKTYLTNECSETMIVITWLIVKHWFIHLFIKISPRCILKLKISIRYAENQGKTNWLNDLIGSLFFFIHLIYLCTYMTTAKKKTYLTNEYSETMKSYLR